jgi:hypothetical protein
MIPSSSSSAPELAVTAAAVIVVREIHVVARPPAARQPNPASEEGLNVNKTTPITNCALTSACERRLRQWLARRGCAGCTNTSRNQSAANAQTQKRSSEQSVRLT